MNEIHGGQPKEHRAKNNPKPSNGQSLGRLNAGAPESELQADLRAIGSFVGDDRGTYGLATALAVNKFQRHFSTDQRPHVGGVTGMVDHATAEMIKKVRP